MIYGGGTPGVSQTLTLSAGEYITRVRLSVDHVKWKDAEFTTSNGNVFGPFVSSLDGSSIVDYNVSFSLMLSYCCFLSVLSSQLSEE